MKQNEEMRKQVQLKFDEEERQMREAKAAKKMELRRIQDLDHA